MKHTNIESVIKDTNSFSQKTIEKSIDIIIEDAHSYKYDLKKEIFTVFYINKLPTEIKFHLTEKERNEIKIIRKYYSLNLNKLKKADEKPGNIYIKDNCLTMPKDYTVLKIWANDFYQEIKIDTGCDDFNTSDANIAKRIKKFIDFVFDIIQSKPEIKNSPTSDILYM